MRPTISLESRKSGEALLAAIRKLRKFRDDGVYRLEPRTDAPGYFEVVRYPNHPSHVGKVVVPTQEEYDHALATLHEQYIRQHIRGDL